MDEVLDELSEDLNHIVDLNGSNPDFDKDEHVFEKPFFVHPFSNGESSIQHRSSCKLILYKTIATNSNVRVWDVIILLPNLTFLLFLLARLRIARQKLRATNSPIFRAFHTLVMTNVVVSVMRCLVSMSVSAASPIGDTTDKLLWILLRFFLLSTEMSVLIFGLGTGHLDSKQGIRRVIVVTSIISLAFSVTQAFLELSYPDPNFHVASARIELFGHGGMLFWLMSSALFTLVYALVLCLPILPCRHIFSLPHKSTFYQYVGFLLILNAVQTIGSVLVYAGSNWGLCLVNLTTYLYFTAFTPIVYFAFLRGFFKVTQPTLLFSYKAQVDDFEPDNMDQREFVEDDDANNTPIVMNSRMTTNDVATGIASPESVLNYNFGS